MQLACLAIVALYVAVRMRRAEDRAAVARRLALLVAASWLGEDSVIRAYGFYFYEARWDLFVDQVPLLIVIIWPVVIDSAWQLARRLAPAHVALVAAAFVLADASLIEPIAVHAGLWRWTEPGLFAVPPIGILGWALFGFSAIALAPRIGALTILVAPLTTHALLLASWWGALRWLNRPIGPWSGAIVACALSLALALWLRARSLGRRIPAEELLVRVPGALFFFVLLALHPSAPLLAWTAAFVPPWLALLAR